MDEVVEKLSEISFRRLKVLPSLLPRKTHNPIRCPPDVIARSFNLSEELLMNIDRS